MNMQQYRRERRQKAMREYIIMIIDVAIVAFVVILSLAVSYGFMLVVPD